jgi:CheY-like chemotaxis protein
MNEELREQFGEQFELENTKENHSSFLKSIDANMNPENNTALLIDDEKGIRKMVARNLKSFAPNLQIYEASNGKEGLEALERIRRSHKKDPLLIVLDLNMPIMNGWDFITQMKHDYEKAGETQGIPIIVLSSTNGEKGFFTVKSVHYGKNDYKPLVTVAKESCLDRSHYSATGEKGLKAWFQYFLAEK